MGLLDQQEPPQGGLLGAALANREAWDQSGNNPAASLLGQYVDWQKNRDFSAELSNPMFWRNMAASFAAPIRAYHGSPYSFDKFDLGKIGTGEGAQAYGHGLYFAEREGVAKAYRDQLSGIRGAEYAEAPTALQQQGLDILNHAGTATRWQTPAPDLLARLIGNYEQTLATAPESAMVGGRAGVTQNIEALKSLDREKLAPPGHMYEVDIHADPNRLLDWDIGLPGQSPHVQQALGDRLGLSTQTNAERFGEVFPASWYGKYAVTPRNGAERQIFDTADEAKRFADQWNGTRIAADLPYMSGREAYQALGSPAAASQELNAAGIPGIRYLDAGSRGAGDGSRNIVAFDPGIVEILRKYGIVAPVAAGGALGGGEQ